MEEGGGTRVGEEGEERERGKCTMHLLIFGSVLHRLVGNERTSYRISVRSGSKVAADPVLGETLDQTWRDIVIKSMQNH